MTYTGRRSYNEDLPAMPSHAAVAKAMAELDADPRERDFGALAQTIAWKCGVEGARRLGRGAVGGSWTGWMAPALRIAPTLRSMKLKGLVDTYYDVEGRTRTRYFLTAAGKALAEEKT